MRLRNDLIDRPWTQKYVQGFFFLRYPMELYKNAEVISNTGDIRAIILDLCEHLKRNHIPPDQIIFIKMPDVGDNYENFTICELANGIKYKLRVGG